MEEPEPLSAALAQLVNHDNPHLRRLGQEIVTSYTEQADRRARVLKHPDLARRLEKEAGYARARQWTGYIPPRLCAEDDAELLRSAHMSHGGELVFRFNQLGKRSAGSLVNDSPRRALLIDIAAEAWKRDHEPAQS